MSETDNSEKSKQQVPDPGVFVTKGMNISIPHFSIRISDDGKLEADPVILHTGIDLCPYWLSIAYDHLLATEKANDNLMQAKDIQNDEQIGEALHAEFTSGMQAIMASGISIDAYYANVKECINIPDEIVKAWRKNSTARHEQIAEVLRRAFKLKKESTKNLKEVLKQNFHYRDLTVHPPAGTTLPGHHPELNKVTDWRFVTFRYYNAKSIVGLSISLIAQTVNKKEKNKSDKLKTYCETLAGNLESLVIRWEEHFGKLYER